MDNIKIRQLLLRSNDNDRSIHFMYYNAAQDRKIVLLTKIINIIVITIVVVFCILLFGKWPADIWGPLVNILPVV